MADGSRWERWDRWPYKVLANALIVVSFGARFLPFLSSDARDVVTIVGLPLVIAGVVLLAGPRLRRARKAADGEIRRNPTGKTVPLDERLASVDRPRVRWAGMVVLALGLGLATAWAIYMATSTGESAFIGFAIYCSSRSRSSAGWRGVPGRYCASAPKRRAP